MSNEEAILVRAYTEQAALYVEALGAADRLSVALSRGAAGDVEVEGLMAKLSLVQEADERIAMTKAAWQKLGYELGPELSAALSKVTELIQKLMSCLQETEQTATKQHKGLLQDLDDLTRGKHMQRAYEMARAVAESGEHY